MVAEVTASSSTAEGAEFASLQVICLVCLRVRIRVRTRVRTVSSNSSSVCICVREYKRMDERKHALAEIIE